MRPLIPALAAFALISTGAAWVIAAPRLFEMTTPVPPEITTPPSVATPIGTLKFDDGFPSDDTVRLVYDNLDRQRAVEVFLDTLPGVSLVAMRRGLRQVGAVDGAIGIWQDLLDPRALLLTGNTESVYAVSWLDTRNGALVIESPPNVLGVIDDFWFRHVSDLGNTGPDKGQGGKFLLLPPDYDGAVPSGFFVLRSPTYNNFLIWRGFTVDGDPRPAVDNIKRHARIYSLTDVGSAPPSTFINLADRAFNTVPANDDSFFQELNEIIQAEPPQSFSAEILGMAASIGLARGKSFAPDTRLRRILSEAAAIGNATARVLAFAPRDAGAALYPDRQWRGAFLGNSYQWLQDGHRYLDARTGFFYAATVNTPAMVNATPGVGSQYAVATRDGSGRWLDGDHRYRLHIAADVPVRDFWSVVVYDPQSRSLLQTDQRFPSVNSLSPALAKNEDGSVDVYFGPQPPPDRQHNWIQTIPGKGWFPIFRLYGPLKPWFDRSWKLADIERLD